MKHALILCGCALLAACAPDRSPPVEKGVTISAKAERSYGLCQVRIADQAYRLNADLGRLRNDLRARFGSRMHRWSTEVRIEALNFTANDCGAAAVAGLHRAGFVKFVLSSAARAGPVAAQPLPSPGGEGEPLRK